MTTRREFIAALGASAAVAGCRFPCGSGISGRIALQLYSIHQYIGGIKGNDGKTSIPGVGLGMALSDVAKIGYKGVEFAGYYGNSAATIRKMLADNGLVACGTHVSNSEFGFDMKEFSYQADILKRTCEFNLEYGNDYICCPGGGNMPPAENGWGAARDAGVPVIKLNDKQSDYVKNLVDLYNLAAKDATEMGARIGLHNHCWEFGLIMPNGENFWDYFFANTDDAICMELDVGWATCAGVDPAVQFRKYPHRSPTLHAKENGMGPKVTKFDAILGKPGEPGATPVDWDRVLEAAEADGVNWWVVECEQHFNSLAAVRPSYEFLKSKGLN